MCLCPRGRLLPLAGGTEAREAGRIVSGRCERAARRSRGGRGRGRGEGRGKFAAARLSSRSQVLIPNSRCQKLLRQRLTNKTFISGYLRKWRVLTCPQGHGTQSERKTPLGRYLQFVEGDFSVPTPSGGQRDLMYCVANFYLFHEKIICILMPEPEVEYNFAGDHSQQALQYSWPLLLQCHVGRLMKK